MSGLDHVTEGKLIRGWASAPKVRVRQAGAADLDHLEWICQLAGAPFETPLRDAITTETAGAGLRAGLRTTGVPGYRRFMAEQFSALGRQAHSPLEAYLHAALVLVAEHRDDGVVGGLLAYPPVTVAEQLLTTLESTGTSGQKMQEMLVSAGLFLTRIKAVAVAEHARGANIGGSLLKRARQIYFHLGYRTIYGAMPPTPGLKEFYRRAGFTVLGPGEPLDLWAMFGHDTKIRPDNREQLFVRHAPVQ